MKVDSAVRTMTVYSATVTDHQPLRIRPRHIITLDGSEAVRETLSAAGKALHADPETYDPEGWLTNRFAVVTADVRRDSALFATSYLDPVLTVLVDGRVVVSYGLDDSTWADLWRAVEDGVYPASLQNEVVITNDGGWGGGGPEIFVEAARLLLSPEVQAIGSLIMGGIASADLVIRARGALQSDRAPWKVRQQAARWAEQGLGLPSQVIDYVYRRPRWSPSLLGTRLRIDTSDAEDLLASCGWVKRLESEVWIPGSFKTSAECLDHWRAIYELIDPDGES